MLLIDLGNSRLKWRQWDGQTLGPVETVPHQDGQLGSAFAVHLSALSNSHKASVSCVARAQLRDALERALDHADIESEWPASPAHGLGLSNSYSQPERLGVDRFLALAAAYSVAGSACCVIDVGTATTVDLCDDQGIHQGGLIAPGPVPLSQALSQQTALPRAADQMPSQLGWATNTEQALQLGALHTACGLIERSFKLAQIQLGCEYAWLTGGGAAWLAPYLDIPLKRDDDLVFRGLILHQQETHGLDPL